MENNGEYLIALNRHQGQFNLIPCGISFPKIEDEAIIGKIAPGINSLDYKEIVNLESCELAFKEIVISGNLQIYTNPTSNAIRIRNSGATYSYDNLELNIFDTAGRKIGTTVHNDALLPNEEWYINIRDFAAGVYVVPVSNAFQKIAYKLVKV